MENGGRATASATSATQPARQGPVGCVTLDYAEALRRMDGERMLLCEIITTFLEDYPTTLAEIRNAVQSADLSALAFSAHKLKGSLATLSAGPAQAAAKHLEQIGRSANVAEASEALRVLEKSIDALVIDLRAIRFTPPMG